MVKGLERVGPRVWIGGAVVVAVVVWSIVGLVRAPADDPRVEQARGLLGMGGGFYALDLRLRRLDTAAGREGLTAEARQGLARALALLQQAVEQEPHSARAWTALGVARLFQYLTANTRGKPEETRTRPLSQSKACFDAALERTPEDLDARRGLLLYHNRLTVMSGSAPTRPGEIIALCRHLLRHAPADPLAQATMARHLSAAGKHEEHEAVVKALLKNSATSTLDYLVKENLMLLSRHYRRRGRLEEAEAMLLKSVERWDPSVRNTAGCYNGCPYQALGELYSHMGKYQKAGDTFAKAARFEGGLAELFIFTLRMFSVGRYDVALRGVAQIEEQRRGGARGDDIWIVSQARVLKGFVQLFERRYEEASGTFAAATALNRHDPGAAVGQGHLLIIRRNYKAAIGKLEPVLTRGPGAPGGGLAVYREQYQRLTHNMAALGLGWIRANQNEHARALGYYDRILKSESGHMLALVGKATSLIALKRPDEAERLFKQVLKRDPKNPYALAELGIIEYNRRNLDKAEARFKASLEHAAPGYTCPHEGLGLVYLSRGRAAEAKAYFQKAIRLNPHMEYKKYNGLARIYIKEGKYAEARKLLQRSITNFKHNREASDLLRQIKGK